MPKLDLDPTQLDRYSRHIIMDDVGPDGQQRLLDASVLVLGAGGLGSPIIQYLAASGIGTLGIADDDNVELSNLQRQIIHGDADVGRPKVESAADFVHQLNPDITVNKHTTRVGVHNIEDLIDGYDFVVDGTDNFETRYLVNDACTLASIPFSHGSIFRFEGQITTFAATSESPCYRCLFPEAPPAGMMPNCATAGVLGVLPGTVGCIQATETIKYIIGKGKLLDGAMIFYDALNMEFDRVEIPKQEECPVCGTDPAIETIHDVEYSASCAIDRGRSAPSIGVRD